MIASSVDGEIVECLEDGWDDYIEGVNKYELKLQVDEWLVKYDRWLTKLANQACKKCHLHGCADDLKSELVMRAYHSIETFNPTFGTPLAAFLISTLWKYVFRKDVVLKIAPIGQYSKSSSEKGLKKRKFSEEGGDLLRTLADTREDSSLAKANGVFSLIEFLPTHDKMLLHLHFEMGMEMNSIDRMLGASRSTTWHKINTILSKVQARCNDAWRSESA